MKAKGLLVTLIAVALSVGCAGRAENPVMIQQYGDDKKTCQALEREMDFIQGEMQRLVPQTEKLERMSCSVSPGSFSWFRHFSWI